MAAALQGWRRGWSGWTAAFVVAVVALAGLLLGVVAIVDPYGLRVAPGRPARPLMDINQRFMYPQLVRSGAFDSGVFGTSTMRLLDPAILSRMIGGRFVNLAMNAATPWEQYQMALLFVRNVAAPRAMIWGIDLPWCGNEATAEKNRLTPRPFPPWLYDTPDWLDTARQMNLTTLEVAGRLVANRLGLLKERVRGDGYEVFTPPEASYDLARARAHLTAVPDAAALELAPPPADLSAARAQWHFPALAWIDEALRLAPAGTLKLLVLPPTHAASLPRPGSLSAVYYEACKGALRELAARQVATLIDYAQVSPLTADDANYWDPLHFRLPVARRVEAELAIVAGGGALAPDGVATVTRPPR